MDPRRPDYNAGGTDPRKRNASQSPDGAQPRKQQRQDNIHDNGPATNQNESRRSSVSNGTPTTRPSNPGVQSPQSRRSSMQAPYGPRKPSDAPTVSSPRSPYESTVSGPSTPQQRPSTLSRETSAQQAKAISRDDKPSSVDPNSLMDLLTKFSSDVAGRAAIEHEKRQAEAQYSNAQREFNEMQKHFISFPSIKERRSADKDAARDAFKAKEKLLLEHTSTQQSTVEMMASLLGKLATPKPSPDVVSRAEYDSLQKDYLDLKQEVMSLKQLRSDLSAVRETADRANKNSGQVSRFQGDVVQVKNDTTMLRNWKHETDARIKDFDKVDQRLNTIGAASTATRKALDDLKDKGLSTLATKDQVTSLERQVIELEKQANELQKQSTERATSSDLLSQNVANLQKAQAKAAADNLNLLAPAKNQALDSEPKERLANLTKEQTELKEQVETLQKSGTDIFNSVEGKIDNAVAEQKNMTKTMHQLGEDIVDFKEKLNMIQESIEEEGKDAIVKRVKRLDFLVNNLSSKIQDGDKAPLFQRVSQLEKDCQALQKDARTVKTLQPPGPTHNKFTDGPMANSMAVETRLNDIEKDLKALPGQQEEKDALVLEEIDKVAESLKAQIGQVEDAFNAKLGNIGKTFNAQLQDARDQGEHNIDLIRKIRESCHELQNSVEKSVNDLQVAMQCKASIESIESFKNELSTLSTEMNKLQAHHPRTKSSSQAPPSAANGPQQFSPQPQQMANGVTGSPQVNGGHFSSYATPYPPSHGQPPTQEMQNMQNMQMQINGLVGVTQQLKMRCDNLTSEDVVRAMVDQFGTMYPEARNFNSSAQSLRNGLNSVQQQLALLQQQKAQPVEQFNEDVKKAAAKAEGAHSTAHTVFQEVQKHWKEINTIKQNVKTIETDVEKLKTNNDPKLNSPLRDAASDARINAEVTSLRNELDQTTKIASDANKLASAADSLSKQHASRFSKTKPEALEKRVAALESTVQDQTQKLGEGEPALKKLQDSAAQAKLEFERVKKNMGALKGRFELLEQGV